MLNDLNQKKEHKQSIVISQSMYFPWVGLFEQIKLADIFVHYNDVQFTKGGFINRVQIKTHQGVSWLTVPVIYQYGKSINETLIDNRKNWKHKQRQSLNHAYAKSPYKDDMLHVFDNVVEDEHQTIASLAKKSILAIADYYSLSSKCQFYNAEDLGIVGKGSQRVLKLAKHFKAHTYITGEGAKNYLDHELFEKNHITVQYMNYKLTPYHQCHGPFIPYVSTLDLIANCGPGGVDIIHSGTIGWHEFLKVNNEKS